MPSLFSITLCLAMAMLLGSCAKKSEYEATNGVGTNGGDGGTGGGEEGGPGGRITGRVLAIEESRVEMEAFLARISASVEIAAGEAVAIAKAGVVAEDVKKGLRAGSDFEDLSARMAGSYVLVERRSLRHRWERLLGEAKAGGAAERKAVLTEEVKSIEKDTRELVSAVADLTTLVSGASPNFRRSWQQAARDGVVFQWPLRNLGFVRRDGVSAVSTGLWEEFQDRMTHRVRVAVIDTGIVSTHPNLRDRINMSLGYDFIADDTMSGDEDSGIDGNPEDPVIGNQNEFHGTHVAGIIAGHPSDTFRFVGVTGAKSTVEIVPLRVLGIDGSGTDFEIAQAVLYASGRYVPPGRTRFVADVINLSLGGPEPSAVLSDAIRQAAEAGVTIVAAAGNSRSSEPSYPAAYPEVIGVGALDFNDLRSSYSNKGVNADLMAPGGGVPVSEVVEPDIGTEAGVLSASVRNGDPYFKWLSGTSMACPHVSGLIGIMKSMVPDLTPGDVRTLLYEGTLPLMCDADECGRGKINAEALLQGAGTFEAKRPIARVTVDRVVLSAGNLSGSVRVENAGSTALRWLGRIEKDLAFFHYPGQEKQWLNARIIPEEGGLRIDLDATIEGLGNDAYTAELTLQTNAETVEYAESGGIDRSGIVRIPVYLCLGACDPRTQVVVVLTRAENARRVVAVAKTSKEKGYAFELSGQPPGTYFLFAGTDDDGDGVICEKGEQCGAYRVLSRPSAVEIGDETSGPYVIAVTPMGSNKSAINTKYVGE